MGFDNPKGKQFRGLRTRQGKLVSNRLGGYERSRVSRLDEDYDTRRRDFKLAALERDQREGMESLGAVMSFARQQVCSVTGETIEPGCKTYFGDVDTVYGGEGELVMVLRYDEAGKVSSAHMVDLYDLQALDREF